jgi:hypothetical protein
LLWNPIIAKLPSPPNLRDAKLVWGGVSIFMRLECGGREIKKQREGRTEAGERKRKR